MRGVGEEDEVNRDELYSERLVARIPESRASVRAGPRLLRSNSTEERVTSPYRFMIASSENGSMTRLDTCWGNRRKN